MQAAVLPRARGTVEVRAVDLRQPGPGEVLLRMRSAGLNPADAFLAKGMYPARPTLPHILGRDGVGEVLEIGAGVATVRPGDMVGVLRCNAGVETWGTLAEKAVIPAASVAPIPYANRIEGDRMSTFHERTALLYDKGPLLLYALHKELGDTQFLTFLKSYTKSFHFKFGTTNGLAGLLQYMTKKDYKPFFEKYFWGTAMPE